MIRAFSFLQRHPQSGVLYFRKRIPKRFREAFHGRHEFKRSLHTCDKKIAMPKALMLSAKLQEKINILEGYMAKDDLKKILIGEIEHPDGRKAKDIVIDEGSPEANAKAYQEAFGGTATPSIQNRNPQPAQNVQYSDLNSKKLKVVIDEFCRFRMKSGAWTKKTAGEYKGKFDLLLQVFGNVEIATITHQKVSDFCNSLLEFPPNPTKGKFAGKTFRQIIDAGHDKTIAPNTYNQNYVTRYSALFEFAVDWGYCPTNPFKGKRLKGARGKKINMRPPFTADDLEKIFNFKDYSKGKLAGWQYWVPLVALYSGGRIQEIAQLRVCDIIQADGVHGMRFVSYEDIKDSNGRLKNVASEREIPIHSKLIEIGFLNHVEKMRDSGQDKLFPELFTTKTIKAGEKAGRWFRETYMKRCGLKPLPLGHNVSFHSFRHNFIDCIKRADVAEVKSNQITGHTTQGMGYGTYGSEFLLKELKPIMELVQYEVMEEMGL